MAVPTVTAVDAFDLPEWLGSGPVCWSATTSLDGGATVQGRLTGVDGVGDAHPCDVLAGDLAYPVAVLDERWRHDAHQAWVLGEVLLVSLDGRLTLVVPGASVDVERLLEAVRRLAKAIGARREAFTVALRL